MSGRGASLRWGVTRAVPIEDSTNMGGTGKVRELRQAA